MLRQLLLLLIILFGNIPYICKSSDSNDEDCQLITAIREGQIDIIQDLLKRDSSVIESIKQGNYCKYERVLIAAVSHNQIDVVKMLLQHGADINCQYRYPTPLITAIIYKHTKMVQFLLTNGADVNRCSDKYHYEDKYHCEYKYTPLMHAASICNNKMVKILLDNGADVNYSKDSDGMNAVMVARNTDIDK